MGGCWWEGISQSRIRKLDFIFLQQDKSSDANSDLQIKYLSLRLVLGFSDAKTFTSSERKQ